MQTRHSIQGHLTGYQAQVKLANSNGFSPVTKEDGVDIPLDDLGIEEVAPKKKEVPFFTKKGKLILAVIIVGSALYYIWQRNQANKANVPQAQPAPAPSPEPQPAPSPQPSSAPEPVSAE